MERAPQLGDLLVSAGVVSKQQLAQALEHQRKHGGMLGEALVALGACSESDIRGALEAQRRNSPLADRLAIIKGREPAGGDSGWCGFDMLEREARRVAHDIRDLSRVLGELSLRAEGARRLQQRDPEVLDCALADVCHQVRAITQALETYTTELAPPWPEGAGLLAMLRQYATHYQRACGGRLELRVGDTDPRTSQRIGVGLFRAIQGLLRGLGESAGSRDATISLTLEGREIVASVSFQRIHSPQGATGDPVGELEEYMRLLGGRMEYYTEGNDELVTCRCQTGPVPAAGSATVVVIS